MLTNLILTLLAFYFLSGLLLFIFQRDFTYFPSPPTFHKTTQFVIDGESIEVVVLNEGNTAAILYFGGNGESVAFNADSFTRLFPDHTSYLVNYRGYGGSTGTPTEQSIYSDAQAIFDAISPHHQQISVIGRSLGTGVATLLAATRPIDKMVLITPYDSIENIARDRYPIFPISLLLKDKFDSASRIKNINSPTLIIIAENDRVIPRKFSDQLIAEFPPAQIKVEIIEGAGHNTLSEYEIYYTLLVNFLSPT